MTTENMPVDPGTPKKRMRGQQLLDDLTPARGGRTLWLCWVIATTAAASIGAAFAGAITNPDAGLLWPPVWVATLGLTTGTAQSLVLRRATQSTGRWRASIGLWWILAIIAGGVVGMVAGFALFGVVLFVILLLGGGTFRRAMKSRLLAFWLCLARQPWSQARSSSSFYERSSIPPATGCGRALRALLVGF